MYDSLVVYTHKKKYLLLYKNVSEVGLEGQTVAVITMSASAYGSPDGLHVRLYQSGELYTQDGPDGLMPARLATSFIALSVASSAGGSVSGGQQTMNNGLLATLLTSDQYDGGFYTPPAFV